MQSDDYKRGWYDGYQTAKSEIRFFPPNPKQKYEIPNACSVCGMSFVDELGRPVAMEYACQRHRCPSRAVAFVPQLCIDNRT